MGIEDEPEDRKGRHAGRYDQGPMAQLGQVLGEGHAALRVAKL